MLASEDVHLSDLDLFEAGPPWASFDALREQDPLHWDEEFDGGKGFWSVTRYTDIVNVLRDTETFSSETGTANLEELDQEQMAIRR